MKMERWLPASTCHQDGGVPSVFKGRDISMGDLSIALLTAIRQTLLVCDELNDNQSLQAIFITSELAPFKYQLDAVSKKSHRVDLLLNNLAGRILSDGRYVLPLFLTELATRYQPPDQLHFDLMALTQKTETAYQKMTPSTERPNAMQLGLPTGTMATDSPLYIERVDDRALLDNILQPRLWFTIKAPRQTGKTSLLVKALAKAEVADASCIHLDFKPFDSKLLVSQDAFLHYFIKSIANAQSGLLLSTSIKNFLEAEPLTAPRMTQLFKNELLKRVTSKNVIIAIDNADWLMGAKFTDSFFSMLRYWHTLSAYKPIWRKLKMVLVISTDHQALIKNPTQSPFNISKVVVLGDFDCHQLSDLNGRYGYPLSEAEIDDCLALFGGHPALTQTGLYEMVHRRWTWQQLKENWHTLPDIDTHLRELHHTLTLNKEVKRRFEVVLAGEYQDINEVELWHRLDRTGLVKKVAGRYVCRNGLYEGYFSQHL